MKMLKESINSVYFDFYREKLFHMEAVVEKLVERIYEIDKRREEKGKRRLCDSVRWRIKSPESMKEKLRRRNLPVSAESAMVNLYDGAGIRIICPYIDDVYIMAEEIARCSDIEVCFVKDYIKNPKENGYRSYHMIVQTPVVVDGETHFVKAEIQIRTMVMNSWAVAEHQLRYKNKRNDDKKQMELLKRCADEMLGIDYSMMRIREKLS